MVPPEPSTVLEGLPKVAQLHGWRRTWYRFRQRRSAMAALIFLVLMLVVTLLAPALAPYAPSDQHLSDRFSGFSTTYWLGTDDLGRDILSRGMFGLRTSLLASSVAVAIALAIGFVIGTASGYLGGFTDGLLMRINDGVMAVPGLLMTMAIIGVLGPGLRSVTIGLGVAFSPTFARLCRGQVLEVKEEQYVEAARVSGARDGRILFRHIVPNAVSPIIVQALMAVGFALLAESALSFLGLSVRPPDASLGSLLQRGFAYRERSQLLIIVPGVMITALAWAFNLVADGLRDAIGRADVGTTP